MGSYYNQGDLANRWNSALAADNGDAGRQAENFYYQAATGFNPQEYANTAAKGAFNSFQRQLNLEMQKLRGAEVGSGRIDTGFGTEDEDRLVTDLGSRLNDTLAQNAMQSAQLYQRNLEGIGSYGADRSNRYLDMLAGMTDRATAEENDKRRRKSGLWGGVGSLLGGVGGFIVGGPAGAAAGSQIGGSIGSGIGGR